MVESGKNGREKREEDRFLEREVSGETQEAHDIKNFLTKTIHSSINNIYFSFTISCFTEGEGYFYETMHHCNFCV